MSSSKSKDSFCSLYSFVKKYNVELYNILDDMCAVGLFRPRYPVTFLNPNKDLTKKLVSMVDSGDSEEAFNELQKLFLYGKHESLSSSDLVTYNRKKLKTDVSSLKKSANYISWKSRDNSVVYEYSLKDFPSEGSEAKPPKLEKSSKKIKGSGMFSDDIKMKITKEIMNSPDDKLQHKVGYHLNSLLEFIKKEDTETFEKIKLLLDSNMVLSWYILVKPGCSSSLISNSLFSKWNSDIKDNAIKSVSLLKELFESNSYDTNKLSEISKDRKEITREGFENTKSDIERSYNDYTKLLEDELRFRYSNDELMSKDTILELNMINWNNPKESLVLIKSPVKGCLYKSVLHKLMLEFVDSSAFKYTMFNDKIHQKFKSVISGAGISGGSNQKMVNMLGGFNRDNIMKMAVNDETLINGFVSSLNPKQMELLKKSLN